MIKDLLFSFNGRIRRMHFWLAAIGIGVVEGVLLTICTMLMRNGGAMMMIGGIVELVILIVGVWIGLAIEIKRWHDRDKSWVWIFISFIPAVGAIWVLVECGFLDGTPGPNKYGPSPKGIVGPAPVAPVAPAA
jgi:uncharacterized membrane protein YhaH (DUF805 family)